MKYLKWCEELTQTMWKAGRDRLTILLPEEEYDELELELSSLRKYPSSLMGVTQIEYFGAGTAITFIKKQTEPKHMTKKISLDGIDEMDALCEKGRKQVKEFVIKLVTQMGHEVESEKPKHEHPKVRPGQVWRTWHGGLRLILNRRDGVFPAVDFSGSPCAVDSELCVEDGAYAFVAHSLEDYFSKKAKGAL